MRASVRRVIRHDYAITASRSPTLGLADALLHGSSLACEAATAPPTGFEKRSMEEALPMRLRSALATTLLLTLCAFGCATHPDERTNVTAAGASGGVTVSGTIDSFSSDAVVI